MSSSERVRYAKDGSVRNFSRGFEPGLHGSPLQIMVDESGRLGTMSEQQANDGKDRNALGKRTNEVSGGPDGDTENVNENERKNEESNDGLHPLQHRYAWYYTRRSRKPPEARGSNAYEDNIKKIFEFSTVERFWQGYCHLIHPSEMPQPSDFHLFKSGIRPLWEDPSNRNGGKWIMRFRKGVADRFWENLVLSFIGERLDSMDNVCGIVLSIRFNEDLISVWNRNAPDSKAVSFLKDSIKFHLSLPPTYVLEYKPHDMALKDMSSFRNTIVRS